MKVIELEGLPEDALAAASLFHQNWLDPIERALGQGTDVMVLLEPADHTHQEWRKAGAAMLGRKHAPQRVNFISGSGAAAKAAETYLENAPGVTGQYLEAAS